MLSAGRGTFTLRTQRFDEVRSFGTTESLDQTYGAKWITDLSVSFRVLGLVSRCVSLHHAPISGEERRIQ